MALKRFSGSVSQPSNYHDVLTVRRRSRSQVAATVVKVAAGGRRLPCASSARRAVGRPCRGRGVPASPQRGAW
jgi:hypothetical protein